VVVAGPATPPDSQATVTDAESAISEDDVDALLPGEELPPSSPDAAVTNDDDPTISDLGLDNEEVPNNEGEEAAALFGIILAMGFDGEKVLLAIIAAKGDGDVAVDYLLNCMPQQGSSDEVEEFDLRDSSDAASRPGLPTSEYISPFTNGYVSTPPPIDPHPTNQSATNKPQKRSLGTSSDTAAPPMNQQKRRRAPTPPRYQGLTREEYMKRSFGEGWRDQAP